MRGVRVYFSVITIFNDCLSLTYQGLETTDKARGRIYK